MTEIVRGALAGCAATIPMTGVMAALHRQLPHRERYPLPPRLIAMRAAADAGIEEDLSERQRLALTLLAHFGMGTAMGALYGLLGRGGHGPAPLTGAAFGLAVWAGNYLGLLPALGVLAPATKPPPLDGSAWRSFPTSFGAPRSGF